MIHNVRIGQKVQRLVALAEQLLGKSDKLTESCDHLLDLTPSSPDFMAGASCLNNDSSPLQLCLTSSPSEISFRVIGDPGSFYPCSEQRYQSSIKTLLYFIDRNKSHELKTVAEQTIQTLVPQHVEERRIYKQGFVWIATNPNQSGIAFYLEMAPLGHNRGWLAVEKWLQLVLPAANAASSVLKKLIKHCIVASAGLEGSTPDNTRAKIYFRLLAPMDIDDLGIEIFSSKEMKDFLALAKGLYEVDLQGLVLNIGFNLSTGALADAKIDLCGHCIRHKPHTWLSVIRQLTDRFSLAPLDTGPILNSGEYGLAFLGLGLTINYKPRLNVYIKHDAQTGIPESDEIWGALKDGMHYLTSIQNLDGSWNDYQLPVGESDQWVTAYVAHSLAQYGNRTGNSKALEAAKKAACWLSEQRTYYSGWGYNGTTGPDADSTAMAIALFDELGMPVEKNDRLFLRKHWREGNCIATYDGPGAWGDGHWDVTPWGYHGMLPQDRDLFYKQFITALETNQMNNGFWRSYWWRNPFYSTFVTLEILDKLNIPEPGNFYVYPNSVQIDNPFDLACYVGMACIRNPSDKRIGGHLRTLLNWQSVKGQWYGSPNLRVTENFCDAPWDHPEGIYYEDKKSTITTATIIRVLSKIIPSKTENNEDISFNWI